MRNVSLSELLLIAIIFALVMSSTRIGRLGEAVAARLGGKRRRDDPRIGVRDAGEPREKT